MLILILNKYDKVGKTIWKLLKPYKKEISIISLCMLVDTIFQMIVPVISKNIIDIGILSRNIKIVFTYSFLLFVISIISNVTQYIQFLKYTKVKNKLNFRLFYYALKQMFKLNILLYNEVNYNQLISEIEFDVENITKVADKNFIESITYILKTIGGLIGLFIISWQLTIALLIIIPLKILLLNIFYKLRKEYFEKWRSKQMEFSFWYGDSLNGLMEIKLWSIYKKKLTEFKKNQRNIYKSFFKFENVNRIDELLENGLQSFVTNILIFILGANFIFHDKMTIGALFAFISYANLILYPLSSLLNIKKDLATILPSIDNYNLFIHKSNESNKSPESLEKWNNNNAVNTIKFQDISIFLKGKKVLNNISFSISKGEKVAIVGANGSGKTSILNVLLRLYKPNTGKVFLNGMDIQNYQIESYRNLFSVVNQKVYLFNTTIKNNITMYERYTNDEIVKACIKSGINDYIKELPEKYDTIVGHDGTNLSGGEKQKIAFARSIIKKSKILILDEATSNFDKISEEHINKLISENRNYDIEIIISHRPDILKCMDKIILIQNGNCIAEGKYDDLFKEHKLFREFIQCE